MSARTADAEFAKTLVLHLDLLELIHERIAEMEALFSVVFTGDERLQRSQVKFLAGVGMGIALNGLTDLEEPIRQLRQLHAVSGRAVQS